MRILEYPSTGTLNEEDVFLMDGPSGTRTLKGLILRLRSVNVFK